MALRLAHIATVDATLSQLLLHQLRHYREAGFDVAGISAVGPHRDDLAAAEIEFFEIPFTRRFDLVSDLKAFVALVRLLRRERFDIIHTHTPKGGLFGQYAGLLAREKHDGGRSELLADRAELKPQPG